MELNRDLQPRPQDLAQANALGATQILPGIAPTPTAASPPGHSWKETSYPGSEGIAKTPHGHSGMHGEQSALPTTAEEFFRLIALSRLCEERPLATWRATCPASALIDSAALSAALVQDKILTPYQASVLLSGRTQGLVLGRYEILAPLGEGGMGMVYRARHRRMRREVAIKILPRELVGSEDVLQRFHREVQAAAKLHHPNIAAAYDADDEDGVHFLVMELVEGPDLSNYVAEAGELPAPVAVQLTIQAARGLAHAHLQGVVHRDIKPANLVVNVQGTLKILDMGLAQLKALGSDEHLELTQMGQAMGTVDYMAPEQAMDARSVDHRADIYSLGCTMYYLLTAQTLSPAGTIVQKLMWHQTAARPSLCDVCRDATPRLDMIFQRMVAIQAGDRYARMQEVVEDLERVLPELRLGDGELPLIGDDLALYIGMDAIAPRSSPRLTVADDDEPPLHATLPPEKATSLAAAIGAPAAPSSALFIEQQLAAAAIMIGKEVAAETVDGRTIRGVVNRLSIEPSPSDPQLRSVRLHVGSSQFGLHEIREVFSGNDADTS